MQMLFWGSLCTIAEIISVLTWIFYDNWIPFAIIMPIAIIISILLVRMYYKSSAYICPECGATFRPGVVEFIFSNHTPKTRKLTCNACGKKVGALKHTMNKNTAHDFVVGSIFQSFKKLFADSHL